MSSELEKIILSNLDKGRILKSKKLIKNPNISMDFIENNLHLNWQLNGISNNPNFDFKILDKIYQKITRFKYFFFELRPVKYSDLSIKVLESTINKYPEKFKHTMFNFSKITNLSLDFIKKHHNKLEWNNISNNENITIDFINKFPNKMWNWYCLSKNKNITFQIIESNSELPWNWNGVTHNPNITFEDIKNNPDKGWDWRYLSRKCPFDIIMNNMQLPWLMDEITYNSSVTFQNVKDNPNIYWDWSSLNMSKNITIEIIKNNPEFNWVSLSNSIPLEIIEQNINYDWYWPAIWKRHDLTYDFIDKFYEKGFDPNDLPLYWVTENGKNFMKLVIKYPNIGWNWNVVCRSAYIDINFFKKYKNFYPFNWLNISKNKGITMEIIDENLLEEDVLPWDWIGISSNPNLTFDFINKHQDKFWCWESIARNSFNYSKKKETINYYAKRKRDTIETVSIFKDELFSKTWDFKRMKRWCLSNLERENLEVRWEKNLNY